MPPEEPDICIAASKKSNGICDGDANIGGACEYDGGDCCLPLIDDSGCHGETCLCYKDWSLHFSITGSSPFFKIPLFKKSSMTYLM